jgi:hypothetical protein
LYRLLCPAPHYGKREISVRLHSGGIWWKIYKNPDCWSLKDPKWRDGHFDPMDFLFGRTKHFETVLSTSQAMAELPEGSYECAVTMKFEWWKRKRAFWRSAQFIRAHIECPKGGIPVPGKGENSWECGDDAIYSRTAPAATVDEAVRSLAEDVLKTRKRRGVAPNWTSSERAA